MSTNTKLVMYAAIVIVALGTTVITTTAMNQVAYAVGDKGIGNDLPDNDGDPKDGNSGLGNSYDCPKDCSKDRDNGIGNDVDRDNDGPRDDGNQGIGNDVVKEGPVE